MTSPTKFYHMIPKKTKAYYCMNCLQSNTVIICLRELKRPSTLQLDHV